MSIYTKKELEDEIESIINELLLSEDMIMNYGANPILPHILVRKVLEQKYKEIALLKNGFIKI